MRYLGPLSTLNRRTFYVDLAEQLELNELLTSVNITTPDEDVEIEFFGATGDDLVTESGHTLYSNQAVYFTAESFISRMAVIPIIINYTTDANNSDTSIVYLKIIPETV